MENVIVRESGEIGAVGDVLAYEFVGILDETLLPGGIRVCKEDFSVQHFCDVFVFGELGAVVGGDGEDVALERAEHLHDEPGDSLGVLAFR